MQPFELTLLHGFKGCSHWAGKMVWDEGGQVVITIDGMRVKTHDAATAVNLHTIRKAHESPVTIGLWMGESEHIITGCMGGTLKVWACQHTDIGGAKQGRRRHRRRRRRLKSVRRPRSSRKGHGHSPALVEKFEGHCGSITGLVRHSLNSSYIVSSGADGTLRVWDVDRLAPVTNVQLPGAAISLWMLRGPSGQSRLVYAEAEGNIRTMVTSQVYDPLSYDTEGAWNLVYFPPLGDSTKEAAGGLVTESGNGRDDEDW